MSDKVNLPTDATTLDAIRILKDAPRESQQLESAVRDVLATRDHLHGVRLEKLLTVPTVADELRQARTVADLVTVRGKVDGMIECLRQCDDGLAASTYLQFGNKVENVVGRVVGAGQLLLRTLGLIK